MKSKWWLIGFLICLAVASVSPLASASPDGLERVADDQGFAGLAQEPSFRVIAEYVFPGIQNETLATILAGITGTVILFAVVYALGWLIVLRRWSRRSEA